MALNLQQIRDYIRSAMDLEIEDLPDTLIDIWVRDGSKRVERAEARWPFFETVLSYNIEVNPFVLYPLSGISTNLDQISSIVVTSHGPLKWVGVDAMNALEEASPTATGRPVYWTRFGDFLQFHPMVDTTYPATVRGYRRANDWIADGSGAVPDLPDELHNTVATWALSKAYAQQEDPEMAAVYERQFADELNEFRRRLVVMPPSQPLVLNGGFLKNDSNMIYRPRYDWELSI